MREVIDKVTYNTATATKLGCRDNHLVYCRDGDWNAFDEALYRTRSGHYFFAGSGGVWTRYAAHYDDGMTGYGHRIIPCERDQAVEWCRRDDVELTSDGEAFLNC